MILLERTTITDLAGLRRALQDALRLEFFTIPPYLIAHHSLSGTSNDVAFARSTIRRIVREEMLHMNLVCNILNAIGGTPDIRAAVPTYPNPLPLALAGGMKIHLKRYSQQLVETVFMEIEKPEIPINIPIRRDNLRAAFAGPGPQTIGQFYATIRAEIDRQADDGIFTGPADRQVDMFFSGPSASVTDRDSAFRAIDTIVEQGEGTPQSPLDLDNVPAHYYAFEQLAKGMKLIMTPHPHFDAGTPLTINDTTDVIQMIDDPQQVQIDAADAAVSAASDQCDRAFSEIVDTLHIGFSENPNQLVSIDDTMRSFGDTMDSVLEKPLTAGAGVGFHAGPRFLYVPASQR